MLWDEDLVRAKRKRLLNAVWFFVAVSASALSLACVFAAFVSEFALPANGQEFLVSSVLISACVALPMAALGAQHVYKIEEYKDGLEAMAATDCLTGLSNRRAFEASARDEIQRIDRTGNPGALALFDLDEFKGVNDRYGHAFGDEVLRVIAEIAYSELRGPFDKLGRWGGEEFIILLSDVTIEQAESVCERLRSRIETEMISFEGKSARVTASFGVAPLFADSVLEGVTRQADEALYGAKLDGRNQVQSERALSSAA